MQCLSVEGGPLGSVYDRFFVYSSETLWFSEIESNPKKFHTDFYSMPFGLLKSEISLSEGTKPS